MTDPLGEVFVSYRRNRIEETSGLTAALRDRGIPEWRDVANLRNEPTEDAIRLVLEGDSTSGAILWITPDVASSNTIKHVEVPLAVKRFRRGDGFWLSIVLADGADYSDLPKVFGETLGPEDLSTWNVTKVSKPWATAAEVVSVARTSLTERLVAIARSPDDSNLIHVTVDAKGTFSKHPRRALCVDWTPYFGDSPPTQVEWEAMARAWSDVSQFAKRLLPKSQSIMLSGTPSLPSAVLMGAGFSTRDGMVPKWMQRMPDGVTVDEWSHNAVQGSELAQDLGWSTSLRHQDANRNALAVMVNVSDNTALAVGSSSAILPNWRATLSITAPAGRNTRASPLSADEVSSVCHLTIDAIRDARQDVQPIETIHLFIAGPAGVGVILGSQLGTLPTIVTYEFDTESQKYVEAARVIS